MRFVRRQEDFLLRWIAEDFERDGKVVLVGQGECDFVDLGHGGEGGAAHLIDRTLNGGTVFRGEDFDHGIHGTFACGGKIGGRLCAVEPFDDGKRRQNTVIGFRQCREFAARIAFKAGFRGFHEQQVTHAAANDGGFAAGGVNFDVRTFTGTAAEGVRMGPMGGFDACPEFLRDLEGNCGDVCVFVEKVPGYRECEIFQTPRCETVCEHVEGVFHGVGRDDRTVVAAGVGGVEITLESNARVEFKNFMDVRGTVDSKDTNTLFAVMLMLDFIHRGKNGGVLDFGVPHWGKACKYNSKDMGLCSIQDINALSMPEFEAVFGPVFEKSPWIAARTWEKRPFRNAGHLRDEFFATVERATDEERLSLIQAHPDLVGRLALQGGLTPESAREQQSAGLLQLSADVVEKFTDYNTRYRAKFGFPFIICARLNSVETILAAFEERLSHDREQELARAWEEIQKIATLRLADIVEDDGSL